MKQLTISLTIVFALLLFNGMGNKAYAATINSAASGPWHSTSTWSGGNIPNANDDVVITGHTVTLSTNQSIQSVIVQSVASAAGKLIVEATGYLTASHATNTLIIRGGEVENAGTINLTVTASSGYTDCIRYENTGNHVRSGRYSGTGTLIMVCTASGNGTAVRMRQLNAPCYFSVGGTYIVSIPNERPFFNIAGNNIIDGTGTITAGTSENPINYNLFLFGTASSSLTIEPTVTFNSFSNIATSDMSPIYFKELGSSSVSLTNKGTINLDGTGSNAIVSTSSNTVTINNQGSINISGAFTQSALGNGSTNSNSALNINNTGSFSIAGLPASTTALNCRQATGGSITFSNSTNATFDLNIANTSIGTSARSRINNSGNIVASGIFNGQFDILTGGVLTVNAGKQISFNGTFINNGTLNLKSNATGTATLLNSGTLSTGSYIVEQYLPTSRNWYVASPLSNAKALGAGFEYWQYNEPNGSNANNWTAVAENETLAPGRGYIVKPEAETTYAFSTTNGTLNTGDITVPITRTTGVTKSGFNLVGNPYPSYLNLNDLLTGELETSYWMRSRNGSNAAWVFDSFNKNGNVAVNNSGKSVTTYIPPMQSFWVRIKPNVASTNLVFNNAMRSHIDNSGNRFRAPQNTPLIRLEISNGTTTDQTVLYAHANASDALDSFDTHKMLNNSASVPDIYSMVGTQKMVINGMSTLPLNVEMPLGIMVKEAGNFSIRASEVRAIDADIVLIDKLNSNAEWLLNGADEYQFASAATTHAERFAIVLRAPGTTTGKNPNNLLSTQTMVFVDAFKNINISCSMAVNKNANVAIYNSVGQKLTQQKLENGSACIAVNHNGVYLVEITVDGATTTKRVIAK